VQGIVVAIEDPTLSDERMDQAASALLQELRRLDVDSIARAPGPAAPAGAKGIGHDVATLLVTAADSKVVPAVVAAVVQWAHGKPSRSIRVAIDGDEIEIKGATDSAQAKLIDSWVTRVTERSDAVT
jgi:Effector Associated Constant Component 1